MVDLDLEQGPASSEQPPSPRNISLFHPVRAIKILLKENNRPIQLGWSVALGVGLGALPLIAIHTIAIIIFATWLKLNRLAAVGASHLCLPPIVPVLCIETGHFLNYGEFIGFESTRRLFELSYGELWDQGLERIWEWFLGSLIVAPSLAIAFGILAYLIAVRVQNSPSKGLVKQDCGVNDGLSEMMEPSNQP